MSTIYSVSNKKNQNNTLLVDMDLYDVNDSPSDDDCTDDCVNDCTDDCVNDCTDDCANDYDGSKDANCDNYSESDESVNNDFLCDDLSDEESDDIELINNTKYNTKHVDWDSTVNFSFDASTRQGKPIDVFFGNAPIDILKRENIKLKVQINDVNKEKNIYKYLLISGCVYTICTYTWKLLSRD